MGGTDGRDSTKRQDSIECLKCWPPGHPPTFNSCLNRYNAFSGFYGAMQFLRWVFTDKCCLYLCSRCTFVVLKVSEVYDLHTASKIIKLPLISFSRENIFRTTDRARIIFQQLHRIKVINKNCRGKFSGASTSVDIHLDIYSETFPKPRVCFRSKKLFLFSFHP